MVPAPGPGRRPRLSRLVQQLFAHRVLENLCAAQGLIALRKRFGDSRLEAARHRVLAFDSPKYRTVKTILHNGLDLQRIAEATFDALASAYTGAGRFCRDTSTRIAPASRDGTQ